MKAETRAADAPMVVRIPAKDLEFGEILGHGRDSEKQTKQPDALSHKTTLLFDLGVHVWTEYDQQPATRRPWAGNETESHSRPAQNGRCKSSFKKKGTDPGEFLYLGLLKKKMFAA
jgi:hypothetical protein